MKIVKTTIDKIKNYRSSYFNSLPEFQDLFLEIMINDSDVYLIRVDNIDIGYTIKNKQDILIEFYLTSKHIPGCNELFRQILKDLSVAEVYCKSFDYLLLNNCLICSLPYSVCGVLYRDFAGALVKKDPEIKMQKADLSSVDFLLAQDDSIKVLFETELQLTEFITKENVFEFYKNGEFVGCGMVMRTNADYDFCDLGVWVNPSKRGKNIGSQIILCLREFAINNNMKPCCGCDIENVASQKTLENSGFVSKHTLISFKVK